METAKSGEVFDLSDIDAADTATMEVMSGDRLTGWIWTFAGPGHEKTIKQADRLAREALRTQRQEEAARVNRRKYSPPEESVDEVRARNISIVVERLLGWSPAPMNGKDFPFSEENARLLLSDRRKVGLLNQALEFLGAENAFTKRSASNSAPSPSERSSSTATPKGARGETA